VKKIISAFICCIVISFFSCDTLEVEPRKSIPLERVFVDDVKKLLNEKSYLEAFQYLERLEREVHEISQEEIIQLREETLSGITNEFNDAVQKQDYLKALNYFISLKNISYHKNILEWSESKLRLKIAESYLDNGEDQIALLEYTNILENMTIEKKTVQQLLELAENNYNVAAINKIVNYMQKKNQSIPVKYVNLAKQVPHISQMVEGTVTIWVNKGVKIEKGMGRPDISLGSGFFIDKRGYVLTNYHVVSSEVDPEYEGYSRLYVMLSDNPEQKIPAKVVSFDKVFDLALLKVEVIPKFVFSTISERDMFTGEKITVIGSPIGLENTVTSGIISSTGRRILQLGDAFQIDAPVNFGNSGGPVISEKGSLLGLVFAGFEQFEGLNFALPAKWINRVIGRLFKDKEITHYWTGLALKETTHGLEVIYVMPGEPAHQAGIQVGDIIKKINDHEHSKIIDIQNLLLEYTQPALVSLTISRDDNTFDTALCLKPRPFIPLETALDRDTKLNLLYPLYGMKLEKVGEYLWENHYQVQRVLEGSIADEIGLSELDSVYIRGWEYDQENKIVLVKILAKRRKKGFLEGIVYLPVLLKTNYFI
jgi:serine protease Do